MSTDHLLTVDVSNLSGLNRDTEIDELECIRIKWQHLVRIDATANINLGSVSVSTKTGQTLIAGSKELGILLNRRNLLGLLVAAPLVGVGTTASAQRRFRRGRRIRRRILRRFRRRHGNAALRQAREAVQQGEVRPLRDVFTMVRQRSNAEILDVDLFRRDDGWVYALRVLTINGRVRDVYLNAKSLEVLEIK